jgi:alpha,alpha-trehalase
MASARTSKILPADLNALLVMELRAMAALQDGQGDAIGAAAHRARADALCGAVNAVLWDPQNHWWADYDLEAGALSSRPGITPAAWFPLWAGCATPGANGSTANMAEQAGTSLVTASLLWQDGGVVTSQVSSGQQWDSPSAWPPLQWAMVEALEAANQSGSARELARRWLRSNLLGYARTGNMFEKYNAFIPGDNAAGGEYTPQTGFGWTNGVVLDFLTRWTWQTLEQ